MSTSHCVISSLRTLSVRFSSLVLLLFLCGGAGGQTTNTDGTTPAGLSPGAPAGSYALSGFESVNLYNGNLNFSLPLAKVGGRGSAGYTIQLSLEQKWRVGRLAETAPGATPVYNPIGTWWGSLKPGYGAGVMEGRRGGHSEWTGQDYCGQAASGYHQWMLTRLTFTAADGTEFELRDQLTGGQPAYLDNVPCGSNGLSRGRVFVSADGSAATFISDSTIFDIKTNPLGNNDKFRPTGYLWLRDGSRYRIVSGRVEQVRDANGNHTDFAFDATDRVTSITDALGRVTTINYAGSNGFAYDQIILNGFNGQPQTVKVWRDSLGNTLKSGNSLQTFTQLFPTPDFSGASGSQFNPTRVSRVEFPNGRSYLLRYNSYGELARVDLPTGGRFEYEWVDGNSSANEGIIYRRVAERRVYLDGTTTTPRSQSRYSDPGTGTAVEVRELDGNDNLLGYSKHYFNGNALTSMLDPGTTPVSYPGLLEGREYQSESYEIVSGAPVLRGRGNTIWQANGTLGDGKSIRASSPPRPWLSRWALIWSPSRHLLTINTTI